VEHSSAPHNSGLYLGLHMTLHKLPRQLPNMDFQVLLYTLYSVKYCSI